METFAVGDVVIINYPFSDFAQSKRRPAFVLISTEYGDLLLAQITSKFLADNNSIEI